LSKIKRWNFRIERFSPSISKVQFIFGQVKGDACYRCVRSGEKS